MTKVSNEVLHRILDNASELVEYLETEWVSTGHEVVDSAGMHVAACEDAETAKLLALAPELAYEVLLLREQLALLSPAKKGKR